MMNKKKAKKALDKIERDLAELASRKKVVSDSQDYGDKVASLILRAADGRIQRPFFVRAMRELTATELLTAFADGAGINIDDITDEQLAALLNDLDAHEDSISKLAEDIYVKGILDEQL